MREKLTIQNTNMISDCIRTRLRYSIITKVVALNASNLVSIPDIPHGPPSPKGVILVQEPGIRLSFAKCGPNKINKKALSGALV